MPAIFFPRMARGALVLMLLLNLMGSGCELSTKYRDLNLEWNDTLEFIVSDPYNMELEELEIEVFNDEKFGNRSGRRNYLLGRVKLYGSQFSKIGEEALVYFPLEKKSVFSWIRGDIGLKICYYDEVVADEQQTPPPSEKDAQQPHQVQEQPKSPAVVVVDEGRVFDVLAHAETSHSHHFHDGSQLPPVVVIGESPPPVVHVHGEPPAPEPAKPPPEAKYTPEVKKMQATRVFTCGGERVSSPHLMRSKPTIYRLAEPTDSPKWNQVFALGHNRPDSTSSTLEIS